MTPEVHFSHALLHKKNNNALKIRALEIFIGNIWFMQRASIAAARNQDDGTKDHQPAEYLQGGD